MKRSLSVTDYEAVYVDGELQTRSVLSVRTVEEPVDRQVEYGRSSRPQPSRGRMRGAFLVFRQPDAERGLQLP